MTDNIGEDATESDIKMRVDNLLDAIKYRSDPEFIAVRRDSEEFRQALGQSLDKATGKMKTPIFCPVFLINQDSRDFKNLFTEPTLPLVSAIESGQCYILMIIICHLPDAAHVPLCIEVIQLNRRANS